MEQEPKLEPTPISFAENKARSNSLPDFFGHTNLSIDGSLSDSINTTPVVHHRRISDSPSSPVASHTPLQSANETTEKAANKEVQNRDEIDSQKKDSAETQQVPLNDSESSSEYSDSSSDSPLPLLYPTQNKGDSAQQEAKESGSKVSESNSDVSDADSSSEDSSDGSESSKGAEGEEANKGSAEIKVDLNDSGKNGSISEIAA